MSVTLQDYNAYGKVSTERNNNDSNNSSNNNNKQTKTENKKKSRGKPLKGHVASSSFIASTFYYCPSSSLQIASEDQQIWSQRDSYSKLCTTINIGFITQRPVVKPNALQT